MKRVAISMTALWLAAGCTIGGDEAMINQVENAVREELGSRGTVKQVELSRENENRLTGYALVEPRDAPGTEVRYNCTADRQGESGASYNWRCSAGDRQASAEGGGAASQPSGDKDPQAAPANAGGASGPGRMAFAGRWTDTGDCSVVTILGEDGSFIAADGGRGTWDVQGSQLIFTGPGGSRALDVYLADPNTIVVTNPDGSIGRSTRC